jgi:glyoxylase-like metal-dependent hydrolase (beta-lactamase superfamily II)
MVRITPIDFSSKHDILIRNFDGSLQPMDEPFYESKIIAQGTWQILSDGDFSYLVEGDDEAVLIDSGYGSGNIREYCKTLTKRPLSKILNTHHHFDHTANNCYFDCAYMSKETKKFATIPSPSFDGIDFPKDYTIVVIGAGYIFHLGNRDLETFELCDHASGSLLFLDPKCRILFSGDEIWAQRKPLNGTVEHYEKQLSVLAVRRGEYDILCSGSDIIEAHWVDRFLECARYILAGHEGEKPVSSPEGEKKILRPGEIVIYDRRTPRPPDMKLIPPDPTYTRVMKYAGCEISYDIRKIRD